MIQTSLVDSQVRILKEQRGRWEKWAEEESKKIDIIQGNDVRYVEKELLALGIKEDEIELDISTANDSEFDVETGEESFHVVDFLVSFLVRGEIVSDFEKVKRNLKSRYPGVWAKKDSFVDGDKPFKVTGTMLFSKTVYLKDEGDSFRSMYQVELKLKEPGLFHGCKIVESKSITYKTVACGTKTEK